MAPFLANAGFENGQAPWTSSAGTVDFNDPNARSGQRAARLKGSIFNQALQLVTRPVSNGDTVHFGAWVRFGADIGLIQVFAFEGNAMPVTSDSISVTPDGQVTVQRRDGASKTVQYLAGGWIPLRHFFTADSDESQMYFCVNAVGSGVDVLLDDCWLGDEPMPIPVLDPHPPARGSREPAQMFQRTLTDEMSGVPLQEYKAVQDDEGHIVDREDVDEPGRDLLKARYTIPPKRERREP